MFDIKTKNRYFIIIRQNSASSSTKKIMNSTSAVVELLVLCCDNKMVIQYPSFVTQSTKQELNVDYYHDMFYVCWSGDKDQI
jgi:hypothetical protein